MYLHAFELIQTNWNLLHEGPQLPKKVRALASYRDYTFAAYGNNIAVFKRAHKVCHNSLINILLYWLLWTMTVKCCLFFFFSKNVICSFYLFSFLVSLKWSNMVYRLFLFSNCYCFLKSYVVSHNVLKFEKEFFLFVTFVVWMYFWEIWGKWISLLQVKWLQYDMLKERFAFFAFSMFFSLGSKYMLSSGTCTFFFSVEMLVWYWKLTPCQVATWSRHIAKVNLLLLFGEHILSIDVDGNMFVWAFKGIEENLSPLGHIKLDDNFTPSCIIHPDTYINKVTAINMSQKDRVNFGIKS